MSGKESMSTEAKAMDSYLLFYREKARDGFYSNFYPAQFDYAGKHYTSSEQYMMAQKAIMMNDLDAYAEIMAAKTPMAAKELGRKVRNYDEELWSSVRFQVVRRGVRAKFQQNRDFRAHLLDTGNRVLVEASPTDALWGVKMSADNPDIANPRLWKGQNQLGQVLMRVRADLRVWIQNGGVDYIDVTSSGMIESSPDTLWDIPFSAVWQNPVAQEILSPFVTCADLLMRKRSMMFSALLEFGSWSLRDIYAASRNQAIDEAPYCALAESLQDLYDAARFGCI